MTNERLIRHPSVINTLNSRICSITAFFPAFNDEDSIAAMVTQALALLPQFTDDYEVIVVNDLSFYTDGDGQYDVGELAKLIPLMTNGESLSAAFQAKASQ